MYSRPLNIPQLHARLIKALTVLYDLVDGIDIEFKQQLKNTLQNLKKLNPEKLTIKSLAGFIELNVATPFQEILSHPSHFKKQERVRDKLRNIYGTLVQISALVEFPAVRLRELEAYYFKCLRELNFLAPEGAPRFSQSLKYK